jgi:hypothetical protein
MDSLKRFRRHQKTIQKIVDANNKNPFTKVWNQMLPEEKTTYMGLINGKINLPEEVMIEHDNNLYSILKQFESKMIEKYGQLLHSK